MASGRVAWFPLTSYPAATYTLPNGQIISPIQASRSLARVDIPVAERLRAAGWHVPQGGVLKVFAAVYNTVESRRFDVQRVACAPPPGHFKDLLHV